MRLPYFALAVLAQLSLWSVAGAVVVWALFF